MKLESIKATGKLFFILQYIIGRKWTLADLLRCFHSHQTRARLSDFWYALQLERRKLLKPLRVERFPSKSLQRWHVRRLELKCCWCRAKTNKSFNTQLYWRLFEISRQQVSEWHDRINREHRCSRLIGTLISPFARQAVSSWQKRLVLGFNDTAASLPPYLDSARSECKKCLNKKTAISKVNVAMRLVTSAEKCVARWSPRFLHADLSHLSRPTTS